MQKKDGIKILAAYAGIFLIALIVKRDIVLEILGLEAVSALVLLWGMKKSKEEERHKRQSELEEDYPDIVNHLALLLESGMTIRQAIIKISDQYMQKKKNKIVESRLAYEEIYYMARQIKEGQNEKRVYQEYANNAEALCFRRLMRLLLNNLEKGTQDVTLLLEEECRQAYISRIRRAKTQGEEASTKMLIPLMMMMVVIMAIVLIPAILSFRI